jgi:uncharacterized C2H2 Zn-finger protein
LKYEKKHVSKNKSRDTKNDTLVTRTNNILITERTFKCDNCGRLFKRNENLRRHLDKNACTNINYRCSMCNKGFSSKNSMYRHMKHSCEAKKEEDQKKEDQKKEDQKKEDIYERLKRLEEQNKRILEENDALKKKVTKNNKTDCTVVYNTHNDYTNSNINNGTINNIYLVGYGKEDMDRIDRSDLLKVLRTGFNSPLTLTETMHFNPKYPEFHNVYIPSMKDKYAMIYDGSEWNMVTKEYLIDKMYNDKRVYIEENLKDFLNSLTLSQKKVLQRWMKDEENHPYIAKIKDDIKLLLYNKRKIPMDNKKVCGVTISDIDDLSLSNNDKIDCIRESEHKVCISPKNDDNTNCIIITKKEKSKRNLRISGDVTRKGTKRKVMHNKL